MDLPRPVEAYSCQQPGFAFRLSALMSRLTIGRSEDDLELGIALRSLTAAMTGLSRCSSAPI